MVTTVSASDVVNAAPFSSFIALSPQPPTVGFVVGGWEGRPKDTLVNIERSGEFVISIVTEAMAPIVEQCTKPLPPDQSEVTLAQLTTIGSTLVAPPRIANSPIAFECRLDRIVPFGNAPDRLIAGRIVRTHLHERVLQDRRIDQTTWKPLGRRGGGTFCGVHELSEPAAGRPGAPQTPRE